MPISNADVQGLSRNRMTFEQAYALTVLPNTSDRLFSDHPAESVVADVASVLERPPLPRLSDKNVLEVAHTRAEVAQWVYAASEIGLYDKEHALTYFVSELGGVAVAQNHVARRIADANLAQVAVLTARRVHTLARTCPELFHRYALHSLAAEAIVDAALLGGASDSGTSLLGCMGVIATTHGFEVGALTNDISHVCYTRAVDLIRSYTSAEQLQQAKVLFQSVLKLGLSKLEARYSVSPTDNPEIHIRRIIRQINRRLTVEKASD